MFVSASDFARRRRFDLTGAHAAVSRRELFAGSEARRIARDLLSREILDERLKRTGRQRLTRQRGTAARTHEGSEATALPTALKRIQRLVVGFGVVGGVAHDLRNIVAHRRAWCGARCDLRLLGATKRSCHRRPVSSFSTREQRHLRHRRERRGDVGKMKLRFVATLRIDDDNF
jgi:hypothetical protein